MSFSAHFRSVGSPITEAEPTLERTTLRRVIDFCRHQPLGTLGMAIVVAIAIAGLGAEWIAPYSPTANDFGAMTEPPSWGHLLGTDQLGRDLLVRSLIGLRNALLIGVASVLGMFALGCMIGLLAGYWGGWLGLVLMRVTDAQMSIPVIILAITILGVSRPTPATIIAVLVLAGWPVYARVSRSVTLSERRKEYVRAAKILGASDWRVILVHIAPNILPPIAFVAVLDVARMMIFEAIFSFIGIGIQPPTPTFGTIIADGTQYLINAWWITTVPGLLLAVSLCSINLMGGVLERARNKLLQGIG